MGGSIEIARNELQSCFALSNQFSREHSNLVGFLSKIEACTPGFVARTRSRSLSNPILRRRFVLTKVLASIV